MCLQSSYVRAAPPSPRQEQFRTVTPTNALPLSATHYVVRIHAQCLDGAYAHYSAWKASHSTRAVRQGPRPPSST